MIGASRYDDVAWFDRVTARRQERRPLNGEIVAPSVVYRSGARHCTDQRVRIIEAFENGGDVAVDGLSSEVENPESGCFLGSGRPDRVEEMPIACSGLTPVATLGETLAVDEQRLEVLEEMGATRVLWRW